MTTIRKNTRQDEDGTPYLAYFDRDLQLGFCWNGHPESPIEISYGGMGESVFTEIPPTINLLSTQTAAMLVREFRFVVNEWADTEWPHYWTTGGVIRDMRTATIVANTEETVQ